MKNFFKFLGIVSLALVIGFSMAGCKDADDGDDNGGNNNNGGGGGGAVTINGLGAHNGKYVLLEIMDPDSDPANLVTHRGFVRYDGTTGVRALIANGTAKVDLFDLQGNKFTGNLSGVNAGILIYQADRGGSIISGTPRYFLNGDVNITNGGTTLDYSAGQ